MTNNMAQYFNCFTGTPLLMRFLVLMTDPAVAYQPGQNYGTFDRGVAQNVFLTNQNGSLNLGVVWPGTLLLSVQ